MTLRQWIRKIEKIACNSHRDRNLIIDLQHYEKINRRNRSRHRHLSGTPLHKPSASPGVRSAVRSKRNRQEVDTAANP